MIEKKLTEITNIVNSRLQELFEKKEPALLWDSMYYSVKAGGKRLRPALNMMACSLRGADTAETLDIACAIEMIHTYSLIHDDLPALDNDDLRRGQPSNHTVFGEAQAILAGDGLLSYAFETMLENAKKYPEHALRHIDAIGAVARAAGVRGMVAGQVLDVQKEAQPVTDAELSFIHEHKTADMIAGALLSGAAIGGLNKAESAALKEYGYEIGLVFQIVDDVLDVTADSSLGKTTGKDARDNKTTFASKFGIAGAMELAKEHTSAAKNALKVFGGAADDLSELADMLLCRRK